MATQVDMLSVIVHVGMVISTMFKRVRMRVAVAMTVERTPVRKLVQELAELGLRLLLLRVQRLARVDELLDRVTQAGEVRVSLRRRGDALDTAKLFQNLFMVRGGSHTGQGICAAPERSGSC